jgi:hypothetical protein
MHKGNQFAGSKDKIKKIPHGIPNRALEKTCTQGYYALFDTK